MKPVDSAAPCSARVASRMRTEKGTATSPEVATGSDPTGLSDTATSPDPADRSDVSAGSGAAAGAPEASAACGAARVLMAVSRLERGRAAGRIRGIQRTDAASYRCAQHGAVPASAQGVREIG